MIQIAIAAFLVWGLFKVLDKEGYVDGFASIAFVLVPAVLVFFVSIAVRTFELPIWVAYVSEISYFLVPLLMLKAMTEFKWPKIVMFSMAVFVVNFLVQVATYLIFSGGNA